MNGLLNDLRFGLRQIKSRPGFAAAAILTLALGIGANTAVFSYLSGFLLKPLPYPHASQLAEINVRVRGNPLIVSLPLYKVVKQQTDAFAATAFYNYGTTSIAVRGSSAVHLSSVYTSASLFNLLGIKPLLGRAFTNRNMHAGSSNVIVISYSLWRGSFGGDPDIIGKTVKLDDGVHRIIGVMPKSFAFPDRRVALWLPYQINPKTFSPRNANWLTVHFIGRLKPGISLNTAHLQIQHAVKPYVQEKVPANLQKIMRGYGFAMVIRPWRKVLLGSRSTTLWLLQSAVLLILLITCVNVANLLLSRILGRSHEIAMRSTLGATRTALSRQLLAEALCLTVPGGLVGVAFAWLALHFLKGSSLGAAGSVFNITLDWRVGLFALAAAIFTAILVSMLPIRHLAKIDLQRVLQEGGQTSSGGRRTRATRNALVIAELTLATGLLAVSGLVLHSFINLQSVDPGFRKSNVLMADLLVPQHDHAGRKALSNFYKDMRRRVRLLPGVKNVATARILPIGGNLNPHTFYVIGQPLPKSGPPSATLNFVSAGYFKTLGIPLLRGQRFNTLVEGDKATVIVDSAAVKKYFHGIDPIGQQVNFAQRAHRGPKIVGVVPSIKYARLSQSSPYPTVYINNSLLPSRSTTLLIHTALPPSALSGPLKSLIASIDPNVSVFNIHTMHQQLADSLHRKRTTMTLLLAFGGIALALAIVGVYAAMSYAVGQRRAECGVRLALGALPEELSWMILKDGFRLLAVGLIFGLGLAVLAGHVISAQLYGVAPFDPMTLIGSAIVLCIITIIACWLPARRAAKVDPAIAMMEQ